MAHITWTGGGEADVSACEDDRVALLSTVASAPGSRPEGALSDGRAFRMKVHRCRRTADGRFEIEGRLLDAPRALRDDLATLPHKVDK